MVESNGGHGRTPYEKKFANFIQLLATTPEEVVIIHHPQVLGDTFDELVESLNRIADSGKKLGVMPRVQRRPGVENW